MSGLRLLSHRESLTATLETNAPQCARTEPVPVEETGK